MRWDELFADLEAQLDQAAGADQRAEVVDRSRRELASITLLDRASAHLGGSLRVGVIGASVVRGRLADVAEQWLLIEESAGREVLVPTGACLWLEGLGRAAEVQSERSVARRLGLGAALRSLAQERVPVHLQLIDSGRVTGTIDRVHAEHVDLAEHPADEARRTAAVRAVRAVPFRAIGLVRPA